MRKSAIFFALLLAASTAFGARVKISEQAELETIAALPIAELWTLANPNTAESNGFSVVSRSYDIEARPKRGAWMACAFVMVGTGDLGIRPVAFRVWTRGECQFAIRSVSSEKPQRQQFVLEIGESKRLELNVESSGRVSVQGVLIGDIVQPR